MTEAGEFRGPAMGLAESAGSADGSCLGATMSTTLGILGAGAAGAYTRYLIDGAVSWHTSGFPWGTLLVNLSGAFLAGFLVTLVTAQTGMSPAARTALTVGFLGAYTTFSTLALQSVRLLEAGSYLAAFLNLAGSMVAGVASVFAGMAAGRALS